MIRWSRRCDGLAIAALAAVTSGCGAAAVHGEPIPDDTRRKPDGVAIDPASSPPAARDKAGADERLVTLRTPLGIDLVVATVADLFQRIVHEDFEGLEGLLTKDALVLSSQSTPQPNQQQKAQGVWEQRFRRLDYTKLAGEVIFREADLSIYRAEDVMDVSPHPGIAADSLVEGDVVVHVPIVTPRVGQDRLLADEMLVWLRREGAQYKIYRMVDDFQLP
jgi:hypothetical protein